MQLDWFDPQTMETVWTETCEPHAGFSFASQIVCSGEFRPASGFFIDSEGKRHFVMHADPGRLGAVMSQ